MLEADLPVRRIARRGPRRRQVRLNSAMLIYQLTDTHYPKDNGLLEAFVDAVAGSRIERPGLVLHSGDLVDGAASQQALQSQLRGARALLDRMGVPWRMCCHSHDRFGDPLERAGESFRAVIGQDFIQHLHAEGLDIFMVSGSVTCDRAYQPEGGGPPPPWGYDLFDPHVVETVERFVTAHAGGPARMLVYHLPVGPMRAADIDGGPLRNQITGIGPEGAARILGLCRRSGIRLVLGGHLHINARTVRHGIHFVTTAAFIDAPRGYRRIEWDGRRMRLRWMALDDQGIDYRHALPGHDPEMARLFHEGSPAERDIQVEFPVQRIRAADSR